MAYKKLFGLVLVAMALPAVQATWQLDAFTDLLAEPSLTNVLMLFFWQIYTWASPFLLGTLSPLLKFLYDEGSLSIDAGTATFVVPMAVLLGFAGVSTWEAFEDNVFSIVTKVALEYVATFAPQFIPLELSFPESMTAPTYSDTEISIATNLMLTSFIPSLADTAM